MYDSGKGKNKDTSNAQKDLEDMDIRKDLHLQKTSTSSKMPQAKYTLTKAENTSFCDWLKNVKFPDGYASNISRYVNTNKGTISGMKSHDFHELLLWGLWPNITGWALGSSEDTSPSEESA